MKQVFFTCMREYLEPLESGKLFSSGGYLETYPLVELAMLNRHPADDCLVELHLPESYTMNPGRFCTLVGFPNGFRKDYIYSITSIKLWEENYTKQCNNGKFDTMYVLKILMGKMRR